VRPANSPDRLKVLRLPNSFCMTTSTTTAPTFSNWETAEAAALLNQDEYLALLDQADPQLGDADALYRALINLFDGEFEADNPLVASYALRGIERIDCHELAAFFRQSAGAPSTPARRAPQSRASTDSALR